MHNNKPKIGISIGDINGIGPEIILKTLEEKYIQHHCIPIIYSTTKVLNYYRKQLNIHELRYNTIQSANEAKPNQVNVIEPWTDIVNIEPGIENEIGGKYAYLSLKAAARDLKDKNLDALVTAPISKKNIQNDEFKFVGHTEYLTSISSKQKSLMVLKAEHMTMALVTSHIPLAEVSKKLSQELIVDKIQTFLATLKKDFGIKKPKIAVLGLNPHSGEQGDIGKEEIEIIQPAINTLKEKGELIMGPYPSDGLLGSGKYRNFDGILAMYHDQGLIPFKMLAFDNGVNFTAGLEFIRTSPDHGTAFDIAGKSLANEGSFRNALFTALDIWRHRHGDGTTI